MEQWDLPYLEDTLLLKPQSQYWLYDAKFNPYTKAGAAPIFAVTSIRHVLVFRIRREGNENIQLIQRIEDEDKDARNSCLTWSKDLETGAPLICSAGGNAKIKVRDARTGKLRVTLVGHGGDVNDLAVSPIDPYILASASADNTVRIWSLNPTHKMQPCAILFAGEGHLDTVLSIAFHGTGRYILSGGQDHVINLWTLPEKPYGYSETMEAIVVHFPHFSTSEIHSNIVDCVTFHGDLILSKAFSENCIVLWQIIDFNSASGLPEAASVRANHDIKRGTQSAFSRPSLLVEGSRQYIRLLQFDVPGCDEFYMRFSLSSTKVTHPILAICNSRSKMFFWDLARLDEYYKYTTPAKDSNQNRLQPTVVPPNWLVPARAENGKTPDRRGPSPAAGSASSLLHTSSLESLPGRTVKPAVKPAASAVRKYAADSPFEVLEAHKVITVPKLRGNGQQTAWSVCGKWCVAVGVPNAIAVFRRGEGRGR